MFARIEFKRYFRKFAEVASWDKVLRSIALLWILAVSFTLLGYVQPVFAQSPAKPQSCNAGVYLMSLYDFNLEENSFGADAWLWTNCAEQVSDPLKLDFINAKSTEVSGEGADKIENIYWTYQKIRGVFRYDWNISNFPFDRHTLKIEIESAVYDGNQFVYRADKEQSKYSKEIKLEEWVITDFSFEEETFIYDSTFGNPSYSKINQAPFSRLILSVTLKRNSLIGFFKLNIGVYIAFAIAMAIYFMPPSSLEGRLGTLVGTLFAVVVNLQVADSVLGGEKDLSLVDKIHITAMSYIVVAVVMSFVSFRDGEKENLVRAIRRDSVAFFLSNISFIVVNIILIVHAARVG